MISQGSIAQARALAIERWRRLHDFDLDDQTWNLLFEQHRPGEVLQAIHKTRFTHDKHVEAVYQSLMYWLNVLESDRLSKSVWPPSDVQPKIN
jgi:hypothetical protein